MLGPKDHKNLSIQSVLNQGSIIPFILENKENVLKPVRATTSSKIQTLATSNSLPFVTLSNSCLCPKVLIIDDNPFKRMALETILNSLEIKSDSVYRGSTAIKKLLDRQSHLCSHECRQYTITFMDQEMPEMSGSDTVLEIKRLQKDKVISSNMKFIGCTAHKGKEEVERFFGSGLDDCIYKPVSIVMLKRNMIHE